MTTPPPLEYRNRRTGLLLFGIFEIILGAICALFIPLILFARMVARQQVYASQPPPPLAPAIAIYGLLAVALVWLGVGSILARRWARALLLCASAVALCVGVIAGVLGAFMMPQIWSAMAQSGQPAIPPAAFIVVKVITAIVMLVIYIIIPGGLFLFYRSSHVKRTCEMLDPVDRWTDRCPLPVLALCLVSAFGGAMMLGMMAAIKAFPLFGLFVSGGWCTVLMLVLAGLQFFLAAGLYRLQIRAWWINLAVYLFFAVSGVVTFWRVDVAELYVKMGWDRHTAAVTGQMLDLPVFKWFVSLSTASFLVWLLCVRRYFPVRASPPAAAPASLGGQ